jgi:hypothetical protein
LLAAACATPAPDVVATKSSTASRKDASAITSIPEFEPCRAGRYTGIMNSTQPLQFAGQIDFSLVETRGGEFTVLNDTSKLSGTGQNGASFVATIPGGSSCVDGTFKTTLDSGIYKASDTSPMVMFDGAIDGQYSAKFTGFTGSWSSRLHFIPGMDAGDFKVGGHWAAIWTSEN